MYRIISGGSLGFFHDLKVDDNNKTITVGIGRMLILEGIHVTFLTTAALGPRNFRFLGLRHDGSIYYQSPNIPLDPSETGQLILGPAVSYGVVAYGDYDVTITAPFPYRYIPSTFAFQVLDDNGVDVDDDILIMVNRQEIPYHKEWL
jgi:hypothetical protein